MLSHVVGQPKPLNDDHKYYLLGALSGRIYGFKAGLCPEITEDVHPLRDCYGKAYKVLYPGLDEGDHPYSYSYEIHPFPFPESGARPFVNFYMIVKKSNTLYRERPSYKIEERFNEITSKPGRFRIYDLDEHGNVIRLTDSAGMEHPCYGYFPYDERYLVHYDPETSRFLVFSGNVYQDKLVRYKGNSESFFLLGRPYAYDAVLLRCSQYFSPKTKLEYGPETDTSYVFYATNTFIPLDGDLHTIMIRIKKTGIYTFGDNWEMVYYSNSNEIPGNEKRQFYEVKYTRSIEPESYHELFPTYRWMDKDEALNTIKSLYYLFSFNGIPRSFDILYSDDWANAYDPSWFEEFEPEEEPASVPKDTE